ncbi:hypothetical protein pipiens_008634 [Culex pipiens pipiens]|uniref:Putative ionotropic receptor ligand binding domain-containing protein n=1 Tax=Culex pipiens pipiens TaxID=38569 RepID=A0ABD1DHS2_CULPP
MVTSTALEPLPDIDSATNLLWQATTALVTSDDFGDKAYTVFISWVSTNDRTSGNVAELTNRVLKSLSGQVALEVIHGLSVKTRRPRGFNLFIVDGEQAFDEIYATICSKLYNFAGYYVVIVLGNDYADEQLIAYRILQQMWRFYVVNINILFARGLVDPEAHMYTYFPFSARFCEEVRPLIWNVFREDRFFSSRKHFPEKLHNFHSCPLTVAVYSYAAFMQLQYGARGEIASLDGVDARLLRYLAMTLNFTYVPQEVPNGLRFGLIYENGTATGAMQMVISGESNFTLGFFGYNLLRHRYMSLSHNYHYSQLVMVVSPVSTLTQLINEHYPIYLIPSEVYVFDNMPELQQQIRIISSANIPQYDNAIRWGQLRGSRVSNYEKVLYDNSKFTDGRYFRMVRQRLYNYALSVAMRINSCLTKPFDDTILELNANGLVQAWVKKYIDRKYASVPEPVDELRKLSVGQLTGAFQVWMIGLGVGILVFAIEVVKGFFECN